MAPARQVFARVVLSVGLCVAPSWATARAAGPDAGWSYNCHGLTCLFAACTAGTGLGEIRYYRFGVRVRTSDRADRDREVTHVVISELTRGREGTHPFTELRMGIGDGDAATVWARRWRQAELGRVIALSRPVPIRAGYRKYVGIYVNTQLPGDADRGHGQAIGGCSGIVV